jgi:hypothetical protein
MKKLCQENDNIVFCDKNKRYSMMYITNGNAPDNKYVKICMKGVSEYDDKEIRYVDTIENTHLPYRLNKNKIYEKIYAMTGEEFKINDKIYIKKKTQLDVKKDFLSEVDYAILTTDVFEKYKDICRSAQVTFLHEYDKMPLEKDIGNAILDPKQKKVFVYPESTEYFFNYIYKFIKHEFILYTFKNYYTEYNKYKTYDYNNYITDCIFV